jgi:ABC-type transport system involved in multi-copper enzyme maturation permease subunit
MAWRAITRQEVHGLAGTRAARAGLWAVALTFVLGGYLLPTAVEAPTTTDYAGYMTPVVVLVLPLFGLLLGYKTVVADRVSGRLTLLLSLPHSRKGAVIGKFAARALALTAVVGAGVLAGSALVAYPFGSLQADVLVGYLLVTLCYGLAFVGIGLAISTFTTSSQVATATTFVVFFLFALLWPQLRTLLVVAQTYFGVGGEEVSDPVLFVLGVEPGMLYRRVLQGLFEGNATGPYLGPEAPWYLGAWPALVLLAVWVGGPLALGYLRFRGTDL